METSSRSDETFVGGGNFQYEVVPGWGQLPTALSNADVAGVATDSKDRVYVFNRGEHPVIVLDRDGKFLHDWGEDLFARAHGIWIGPDDMLYFTDDFDHTVHKCTLSGDVILTLGTSGCPSDTGVVNFDYRTMKQPGPPFNYPTNLALSVEGEMYVSDGYGNARIHRFSPDGELLFSWGESGDGPGQFHVPHGIGVDSTGRVFVADRENNRLQIFTPDGEFLSEWTQVVRPCELFIDSEDNVFVAEVGRRCGLFPWMTPDPKSTGGRVSVFNRDGELQTRWGGGDHPCAPSDFYAPHDIWVDSQGSVYVGEVTWSAGGKHGLVPLDCPSLKKLIKRKN